MLTRKIPFVFLVLIIFQTAFAQTTDKEKPKGVTDELRREAVEFLRETSSEVGNLRSLENRIGFASEMAGLMWFYDAKQASAMYQNVITDFKQLLADYDAQLNALNLTPDESQNRANMFLGDESDKAQLNQKFYKAMGVRQQIAMSLAEHDAALAYDFYYETLAIITNPEIRKSVEQRDAMFESQLINRIAENDPAKALEMGRRSLSKGVSWAHVDLLRKLYEKDNDKGAAFAAEVLGKFKANKASTENYFNVVSFLQLGDENAEKLKKDGGKKRMFTDQQMREMAEMIASVMLNEGDRAETSVKSYLPLIEKYAPARAVQIRAKYPEKTPVRANSSGTGRLEDPEVRVRTAPPISSDIESQIAEADQKQKNEKQMAENVQKLASKELPKEEREKIVAESRKIIGGIGNRQQKLMSLSLLASQVARAGDKELASEIMKDAQTLINPSPKNYRDFMEVWMLASAYAETDADKAFPVLEDAIFRVNDTLSAFIKVAEFIDVSGEMIDDGEIQLSSMGGSMVNGLTRELGIATPTVRNLAIADFGKTKALTSKFDRTEVRILAKMLVLRAILGDKIEKKEAETEVGIEEN